ncbi:protein PHYLLO, chloroplastic-like isoform X2 [Bidens hawaiensis]|uniref:protein PHYLLO, chloroplastic-like isoform X2 n=2 Tax=Bidens hawaiensis TaxID=980011 RepID=UPI00404AB1A5
MNLHTNLISLLLPSKPHVMIPSTRRRFTHLHQQRNYKIVRYSIQREEIKFLEAGEAALLVGTCITRTLTPALTLELGVQSIKDAVIELKSKRNYDKDKAGMYRFQIAVSPGSKALSWFCCQDASLEVFPQFFISTAVETSTNKFLSFSRTRGVFGIGAAVYIKTNFSSASADQISFRRYQPVDSTYPTAYGLFENNSFYMFIPQIELVESEGLSILTATLAWNDSSRYEDAFDVIIRLITVLAMPNEDNRLNRCVSSVLRKFNMMVDEHAQMVYKNALLLTDGCLEHMELENASLSSQFSLRLSANVSISNNMLDQSRDISFSLKESANINAVWASLMVEECYRLGLTYFCIAPGSRSSPLAIAATCHPMISCIACIDERSLTFHAIGYARGCHKPAVVITSSGTAVSNLLPAVVEASQDFLPLLLLTADRPPELLDTGANQAINQVNHYGSYVRHSFSLPAPTDVISTRMVLTTIDSAVYHATSSPCGPVHINCSFREPLENTPQEWSQSCLKGLDFWVSSGQPFTNYIHSHNSFTHSSLADVLNIIQGAKRGLLLVGAVFNENDIYAAVLLAKHLKWPVVADILSGLRLRKYKSACYKPNEDILFIDHLDHSLLSAEVKQWVKPDVIVQIGSRITSKRVSQMLQDCSPCSYILIDNHPNRHDPSHIITHRVHSSISQFTDQVLRSCVTTRIDSKWTSFLCSINMMVDWEISFLLNSENSLTEPYVAYITSVALDYGSTMFLGNSMPIRDADMYGNGSTRGSAPSSSSGFPFHWIQVAGNRGASGIDGLLSTAVGFAVGHNKRVVCVIGDVSFLHDTNGLALLKQRISRKHMTIIVVNNHGGAIFSLLPIASMTEEEILNKYFYTTHNVGIQNLCLAHGVKHVHVHTKAELQNAVIKSQHEEVDCVIEVESSIDANANFHSKLRQFACQAASHAFSTISRLSAPKICKLESFQYRIQLLAPLTTTRFGNRHSEHYREGFVLTLFLEDGSKGIGEVAPLGNHKENMLDVKEQLQFLTHVIKAVPLYSSLPLLKGSFSKWISTILGIPPDSLLPSVRCGLEMAVLNAMAAAEGSTMLDLLHPYAPKEECSRKSLNVKVCALVDSDETPEEVANVAATLVDEGFTAIKLKVARRANPIEDAIVIQKIRKKVGFKVHLRADANRKWSYNQALQFGSNVKDCALQYIEEPVNDEDDIIKFCEETGLPVALDETIDNLKEDPIKTLARFKHNGIVAVVIKPTFVGGFEKAALIARWAQQQGKMAVVSAAFESGFALSAYVQFSCFLEIQNAELCNLMNVEPAPPVAHGLGTYKWLKEDVTTEPFSISRGEASVFDAGQTLVNFNINQNSLIQSLNAVEVRNYELKVDVEGVTFSINVKELGDEKNDNVIVFLHGFLGTSEDWIPIITAMSASSRCIALDLPGLGSSKMHVHDDMDREADLSMKLVAGMLNKLFLILTASKVTVVGYSMGARIALYLALRCNKMVKGAVIISGSPGLDDEVKRSVRSVKDDFLARAIVSYRLDLFMETWYSGELWRSLRSHPQFNQIVASRMKHDNVEALAKALSDLSTGRQPSLWEDLKHNKSPILLIVGDKDEKFKKIGQSMWSKLKSQDHSVKRLHTMVKIPDSGHAVHIENPLLVIQSISEFVTRLNMVLDS